MRTLTALIAFTLWSVSVAVQGASTNLSPATYNSLNEIQTFLAEEQYSEAEEALLELEDDLQPGFGLALTYQLHGQMSLLQENQPQALSWFRKSLALNALTTVQEINLATTVAQLQLADGQYRQIINDLQPRLRKAEQQERDAAERKNDGNTQFIQPVTYVTLAAAHQLLKEYSPSIPYLQQAISRSRADGDTPKENWLVMLMAAYYQTEQYPQAAATLDDLLRINPQKEDYWQQQAAVYQLMKKPAKALRTLELGYAAGYVTKADSIMLLVQLLITQNIPERAGRLLQKHLSDNTLELNERNWKLLASAWQQGRERDKAIAALEKAAAFMDDGGLLFRAARMASQDAHFSESLRLTEAAIKKGLSDKDKPRALMLAGSSAYEMKDFRTAQRYFQQALTHADSAGNARAWLDYIAALEDYPLP
ncbi:MAG: hypothetical protein KYX62_14510 [Pseudomonadota bacterium]|nr:hypothetical protein [Pseudomonadota bacterium]